MPSGGCYSAVFLFMFPSFLPLSLCLKCLAFWKEKLFAVTVDFEAWGWIKSPSVIIPRLERKQMTVKHWTAAFPSLDSLWLEPLMEIHSWFLYPVINNRRMLWKYVRYQNVLRNIWATEYWSRSWTWSKYQRTDHTLHWGLPCLLDGNCFYCQSLNEESFPELLW